MKKINTIVKSDTPPVTGDEALWVDTSGGDNSIKLKVKGEGGKYTPVYTAEGMDISDLEDKIQENKDSIVDLTATLAAKEDVANKVTSINADADDVHYPSAKAVKDSLAKVKNIEVTPDMLSESTKQFINASGGGTITNFADDEDLTTVDNALKLADKTYDPITFSGMGRKYLRKNLVDGKNILTQEMLPSTSTIYIIQYDYDLNGATITIPENCTLDFQGGSLSNGTVTFSNTELKGTPRIYTNFGGVIANDTIHTKWFINLPDDADCSQTLRRVVKLAYTSSVNSSGWRMCKAIHIDAGIYTVKNSLIDSSLGVTAGRFNVTGDGYVNTTINYDNSNVALFDNQQIFGFSKFEGISFVANNNATFANLVGGGSGNSQSFMFENCSFQMWTTILNSSGGTMNSEITFANCKISSCGSTENKCMLFILNNQQAVNWRFIGTDIETCFGIYFEAIRGFNISIYQGSMIPYSEDKDNPSVFLHVPSNADYKSFGDSNAPHLIVNQSRFELRSYAHLIKKENRAVWLVCKFNDVGLGGSNLIKDEDFFTLYINGTIALYFSGCNNYTNYKYYHIVNQGSYNPANIYADSGLFRLLAKNSTDVNEVASSNSWSCLYLHDNQTSEVIRCYSKGAKGFAINGNAREISEAISKSAETNTIAIYSGHQTSIKIEKPMILTGLTILHTGTPAYGDMIVKYKVTTLDADGNDVDTIMMSSVDNRYSRRMSAYIRNNAAVHGVKIAITDNFYTDVAVVVRGLIKLSYL